MSDALRAVEAVFLLLSVGATIVAVAGIAFAKDAFAQLLYGSIPGGAALIAMAIAVAIDQGLTVGTTQAIILVLLAIPSASIAAHRIAAVVHQRDAQDGDADDAGEKASAS